MARKEVHPQYVYGYIDAKIDEILSRNDISRKEFEAKRKSSRR